MLEPIILIAVLCVGAILGVPFGWWLRSHEQKRLDRERAEEQARISRVKTERAGRPHPPRKGAGSPIRKHRIRRRRG